MTEALPITFTTQGLFESGDSKSEFLISKLEAWLNYRGLCANWYADEDKVMSMAICLLPEKMFLSHQVDQNKVWSTLNEPTALFHHDEVTCHFECYLMLSNNEIDEAMKNPQDLERKLQLKLATVANKFASAYHLAAI